MEHTGAKCNIVVCDDGMMAFLKDNFAAAEMLWGGDVEGYPMEGLQTQQAPQGPRQSRRHLKGLKTDP
jgi:hypothetical protein